MGSLWVITGPPGVGKSTLVSKVVTRAMSRGVIVGGCVTTEWRTRGERVGFKIRSLSTGETGELSSTRSKMGPKVGRYRVNLVDLASVGAGSLNSAASSSELIVIDELGPMELVSPEFRRAALLCLGSGRPILAVAHERMEDDVILAFKSAAGSVVEVSLLNRDSLADELSRAVLAVVSPKA